MIQKSDLRILHRTVNICFSPLLSLIWFEPLLCISARSLSRNSVAITNIVSLLRLSLTKILWSGELANLNEGLVAMSSPGEKPIARYFYIRQSPLSPALQGTSDDVRSPTKLSNACWWQSLDARTPFLANVDFLPNLVITGWIEISFTTLLSQN